MLWPTYLLTARRAFPVRALVTLVALVALGGCRTHPQVLVSITLERSVVSEAATMRVEVYDDDDVLVYPSESTPAPTPGLTVSIPPITAIDADPDRTFRVESILFDASGAEFSRVSARSTYTDNAVAYLRLHHSRSCSGVACEDGMTCFDGVCVGACISQTDLVGRRSTPECTECESCVVDAVTDVLGCVPRAAATSCGCGLSCDGAGACAGGTSAVRLSSGLEQSCVLDDGISLICWGSDANGQLLLESVGEGQSRGPTRIASNVATTSGGHGFACAVDNSDRDVRCWGRNVEGIFNQTSPSQSAEAVLIELPEERILQVSAGRNFVCAVGEEGQLYCWGGCDDGQLGLVDCPSSENLPVREVVELVNAPGERTIDLCSGWEHSCALSSEGRVRCWGDNRVRQVHPDAVGQGAQFAEVPLRNTSGVRDIACGAFHSCILHEDGEAWCWGANGSGATGTGVVDGDETGFRYGRAGGDADLRFSAMDCGDSHCCALELETDLLFCWGSNSEGQLGDDRLTVEGSPALISPHRRWRAIGAGSRHTCAIGRDEDFVWCWGQNDRGQVDGELESIVSSAHRVCLP